MIFSHWTERLGNIPDKCSDALKINTVEFSKDQVKRGDLQNYIVYLLAMNREHEKVSFAFNAKEDGSYTLQYVLRDFENYETLPDCEEFKYVRNYQKICDAYGFPFGPIECFQKEHSYKTVLDWYTTECGYYQKSDGTWAQIDDDDYVEEDDDEYLTQEQLNEKYKNITELDINCLYGGVDPRKR